MSEYTSGKLEVAGRIKQISRGENTEVWEAVMDEIGNCIIKCLPAGHPGNTTENRIKMAEANARELVRRWNCHKELVACCDYAFGYITERDSNSKQDKAEVVELLQAALAAAQE